MKIILIEDSEVVSVFLEKKIKSVFDNTEIKTFKKVTDAISSVDVEADLLIVDHILPDHNGIETLPLLRNVFPNAKIIIHSSQNETKMVSNAYRMGANLYIAKEKNSSEKIIEVIKGAFEEIENGKSTVGQAIKYIKSFSSTKNKKVFIVEDDSVFAYLAAKKIENIPNTTVFHYRTSKQAIDALFEKPDLIILDYYLSTESIGLEVQQKAREITPHSKIMYVSSLENINVASSLIQGGADYYIYKDNSSLEKMEQAVRKLIFC